MSHVLKFTIVKSSQVDVSFCIFINYPGLVYYFILGETNNVSFVPIESPTQQTFCNKGTVELSVLLPPIILVCENTTVEAQVVQQVASVDIYGRQSGKRFVFLQALLN